MIKQRAHIAEAEGERQTLRMWDKKEYYEVQTIWKGGIRWQTMMLFQNLELNPDAEAFNLHISPQNGRVCDAVLLGAAFGKWLHFYPHSFIAGLEAKLPLLKAPATVRSPWEKRGLPQRCSFN